MSKKVKQDNNETPKGATEDNNETATATEQESILNTEDPILDATEDNTTESDQDENDAISGKIFGQLSKLEEEVREYKEQSLRLQAEMANTKRRADMSVEKAHKFGIEKLAKELIPVIDSLEKGIESAEQADGDQHSSFIEGLHLVLKQFLGALEKFGIEQINPAGEPFDPHYHQAVATVSKPEAEPNTVVEVCQKGCKLHERLLRPAMVVVSAK
jgi:molecular chaperone GrpE